MTRVVSNVLVAPTVSADGALPGERDARVPDHVGHGIHADVARRDHHDHAGAHRRLDRLDQRVRWLPVRRWDGRATCS